MSPGTSFSAGIIAVCPLRRVLASGESMLRIEFERLLRPAFLKEAEQSVDDDHGEDDRRVEPQAHHQLDEAGGEQDIDEDIVELLQETHERPALARGRQAR